MEDLDFIRRLKNKKSLKRLTIPIYTSSRKWEKTNIIFQAFKNWSYRKRWLRGESIKSLHNDKPNWNNSFMSGFYSIN